MNRDYFKTAMRRANLTASDLADAIGRDRTVISRILSGDRSLKPSDAEAFAEKLGLPLEDVLENAGVFHQRTPTVSARGFGENDVTPFDWSDAPTARSAFAAQFGFDKPGVDVWQVKNDNMILGGYRSGDNIVVDTSLAGRAASGDDVIAQVYDWKSGTASTVLRRFDAPVIYALSPNSAEIRPEIADGERVVIMGVVQHSWR